MLLSLNVSIDARKDIYKSILYRITAPNEPYVLQDLTEEEKKYYTYLYDRYSPHFDEIRKLFLDKSTELDLRLKVITNEDTRAEYIISLLEQEIIKNASDIPTPEDMTILSLDVSIEAREDMYKSILHMITAPNVPYKMQELTAQEQLYYKYLLDKYLPHVNDMQKSIMEDSELALRLKVITNEVERAEYVISLLEEIIIEKTEKTSRTH